MANPLLVAIIVLIAFLLLDSIKKAGPLITNVLLLLFFLWAYANKVIPEGQAIFYAILAIMSLLFPLLWEVTYSSTHGTFFEKRFSGIGFQLLAVFTGLGIFAFMYFIQSTRPQAAIIGTPVLSVFTSGFTKAFSTTGSGLLGIIENRGFLSLIGFIALLLRPFYSFIFIFFEAIVPVISTIVVALTFAIFHVAAFNLVISSIFFAFIVFVLWVVSFLFFKDDTPANIAHYLWNISVIIRKGVQLVT